MAIDKTLNTSVETQEQDSIFDGLEDLQEVTRQSSLYDLYAVSILNESSIEEKEDREWFVIPNNFTDDSSISKSRSFSTRQQCEAPLRLVDSSSTISQQTHIELEKHGLASNVLIEDTQRLSFNKADELLIPHCEPVCRIDSSTTSEQDLDSKKRCLADDEFREDTQDQEHWPLKKKQRSTKRCGRVWSLDVNPIPSGRRCRHCGTDKTPLWRLGPMGPKTLCNACGVRYRSGRLVPEYRPVASPTFDCKRHSNSHKKIVQMTRNRSVTCY